MYIYMYIHAMSTNLESYLETKSSLCSSSDPQDVKQEKKPG